MALHGDSSGEFDIKSPADKFFTSFADDISSTFHIICKSFNSSTIHSHIFLYHRSNPLTNWCSFTVAKEKRTVTLSLSGNLVSDSYKTFKATITVTPAEDEGNGSRVVWTVEFEKIRHDIEDPMWIIDILINYLKETDENLNI